MRRRLAALVVLLSLGAAGPAASQTPAGAASAELDPESLVIANQIVDLAFPPATRQATLMRMVETMMAQARAASLDTLGGQLDAGAEQILERHFERLRVVSERLIATESAPLFTALARAYVRRFTRSELIEIRAFVATPTGAKYLQQSSEMLSDPDVARANTAYMTRALEAIQPAMENLTREMRDYVQANERRTSRRR